MLAGRRGAVALAALVLALCAWVGVAAPVGAAGSAPPATRLLRPNITPWLIPFGPKRKHQMAAYSERHYGENTWRLRHPRVIVEHVSETDSARAVFDTFAPDVPDVELHSLTVQLEVLRRLHPRQIKIPHQEENALAEIFEGGTEGSRPSAHPPAEQAAHPGSGRGGGEQDEKEEPVEDQEHRRQDQARDQRRQNLRHQGVAHHVQALRVLNNGGMQSPEIGVIEVGP